MSDEAEYFRTETNQLVLPARIQDAVDAVVAAFRGGKTDALAYKRLTSWLDEYGDDVIFDYDATIHALSPSVMRSTFEALDDEEIAMTLELASEEEVTDAHRINFLEEHAFPNLFMDGDDNSSAFTPFRAVTRDGNDAVLVNDTRGNSFSGITSEWFGPFAHFDEFASSLEAEGWAMGDRGFRSLPMDAKLRILRG